MKGRGKERVREGKMERGRESGRRKRRNLRERRGREVDGKAERDRDREQMCA